MIILLGCHAENLSSESKNGGDDNNDIIPENMGKLLMQFAVVKWRIVDRENEGKFLFGYLFFDFLLQFINIGKLQYLKRITVKNKKRKQKKQNHSPQGGQF